MTEQETLALLVAFFQRDNWLIENDEHDHIVAVMSSGYGSGPAVIDLTNLVRDIHGR
jgi:hypothetical protein